MFSGFLIAFVLRRFDVPGVFALITFAMGVVIGVIGCFGPRTKNLNLDAIAGQPGGGPDLESQTVYE